MKATVEQVLAAQRDPEAMAAFCEANKALVYDTAWKLIGRGTNRDAYRTPAGLEWDDIVQIAWIGFIQAVRGYDPARGCAFSTYAVPCMLNVMLDSLRKRAAGGVLLSQGQHDARMTPLVFSINEAVFDDGDGEALALESTLADQSDEIEEAEARADARALLATLRPAARSVVRAIVYNGLTQTETAAVVGISQAHVSRTFAKAMERMAQSLGRHATPMKHRHLNGTPHAAKRGSRATHAPRAAS